MITLFLTLCYYLFIWPFVIMIKLITWPFKLILRIAILPFRLLEWIISLPGRLLFPNKYITTRSDDKLKTIHLQKIIDEKAALGYSTKVLAEIKQTAKQVLDYAMEYDILFGNVFYLVKIPNDYLTENNITAVV